MWASGGLICLNPSPTGVDNEELEYTKELFRLVEQVGNDESVRGRDRILILIETV